MTNEQKNVVLTYQDLRTKYEVEVNSDGVVAVYSAPINAEVWSICSFNSLPDKIQIAIYRAIYSQ